ncbi:hypothetical protein PIB30_052205 [Stylosanthes scabra]|uniref:Uncharacterized protein n=1 Tax=Stylosanthes scabra TaxID=79078 RepID=A0ABU6XIN8_9FABA|nr:hypothetical protein [Stylosanthes scabra]
MENTEMNSATKNSVSPGDEPKRDGDERGNQKRERSEEIFENKRMKLSQEGFEVGEKSPKNENPAPLPPPSSPSINDALALTLKQPNEGGDVDENKGNEEEEEAAAIDDDHALRDIEVDAFVMDRNHDDEKPVAFDFDLNELPSEVDKDWW